MLRLVPLGVKSFWLAYWNPDCFFDLIWSRSTDGWYDPGPGQGTGDNIIFLSVVDLKGAVAVFGESKMSLSLTV